MKCADSPILDDSYFMRQALIEARKAFNQGEVPVGAVVVFKQQIIARAFNLTEQLNDVTAHAEMQAVTAASNVMGGKYLTDCVLYVTLEPCAMCAGALRWSQLSKVVFGASDKQRGFMSFQPSLLHPKTEVVQGVLEVDCASLMKDFFKQRR